MCRCNAIHNPCNNSYFLKEIQGFMYDVILAFNAVYNIAILQKITYNSEHWYKTVDADGE